MNEQVVINSLEFAEKSLETHGTIAVSDLPRLGETLFSRDGELSYRLKGGTSARGEPELRLHVQGRLNLVCQRCLGPLEFALDTVARIVVAVGEDEMPAPEEEQDDADYMVADTRLDVLSLIEDEVLLSLPLAPVHADENCNRVISSAQEQKESPFKVLQGLKLSRD